MTEKDGPDQRLVVSDVSALTTLEGLRTLRHHDLGFQGAVIPMRSKLRNLTEDHEIRNVML